MGCLKRSKWNVANTNSEIIIVAPLARERVLPSSAECSPSTGSWSPAALQSKNSEIISQKQVEFTFQDLTPGL